MPIMNLHRKGKTFADDGTSLTFDPTTQVFEGQYIYQKAGKPLRIKKEIRSRLDWYKEDYPTKFKTLAEGIAIELAKY